ncbi:hypothetical protein MIND_01346200 [Mycena indigotica]|uniref:DUF6534 domain-containing protein n=1 Tax=Mycena indigotica TaxID=2126181 RepID=A0A8H6VRV8_9AGAR|nr:uncharacterized protein MIND_01346200 [Mycena indigotica]KAF7289726.1 hypothetical protein MIND_01346200 [Mycena indigotica]
MAHVALTLGPLLLGGSIALMLSGMVTVQCIVFYKLYPNEIRLWIGMVFFIWVLDLLHSIFIVISLFDYFITFFGEESRTDFIPWSIALSVVVTAITTLIVHMYYAQKIFKSSTRNWWITAPVIILAFLRLFAASVSTTEMIRLRRYSAFMETYPGWVFTTGLSLSASVDFIITTLLCYFLRKLRQRTASTLMAHMVDVLTLFTLENGLLTFMTVTASLICWLTMPNNLVFLGLHFVIGKRALIHVVSCNRNADRTGMPTVYANSCLISLNTRKELREMRWAKNNDWGPALPVLTPDDFGGARLQQGRRIGRSSSTLLQHAASSSRLTFEPSPAVFPLGMPSFAPLQVSVERTVTRNSEDLRDVLQRDYYHGQRYQWHLPAAPRYTTGGAHTQNPSSGVGA